MIDRSSAHPLPSQKKGPGEPHSPWIAGPLLSPVHAAEEEEIDLTGLPVMPDFATIPTAQLLQLLPPPLQSHFLLSTSYVHLIQTARQLHPNSVAAIVATLRKSAQQLGGTHTQFGAAITLLARALQNDIAEEPRMLRHFDKLQELFEMLPNKDRELLLDTIGETILTCQPLVEQNRCPVP